MMSAAILKARCQLQYWRHEKSDKVSFFQRSLWKIFAFGNFLKQSWFCADKKMVSANRAQWGAYRQIKSAFHNIRIEGRNHRAGMFYHTGSPPPSPPPRAISAAFSVTNLDVHGVGANAWALAGGWHLVGRDNIDNNNSSNNSNTFWTFRQHQWSGVCQVWKKSLLLNVFTSEFYSR